MKIAVTVARYLLGALFTFAGLIPFINHTAQPPLPGLAGTFNDVGYASHFVMFIGAAQLAIGVLLLVNRYVPIALIMLAAFLYNSFAYHITMMPSALPAPVIVLILGYLVAQPYRRVFAPLFAADPLGGERAVEG